MKDVKQAILIAAEERFSRFGFRKTTVEEICRDCGISKKTLYGYFGNKEEILCMLYVHELKYITGELSGQVHAMGDAAHQLGEMIKWTAVYLQEHRFLLNSMNDSQLAVFPPGWMGDCLYRLEKELSNRIARMIQKGKKQGVFREVDEGHAAHMIFVLLQKIVNSDCLRHVNGRELMGDLPVLADLLVWRLVCQNRRTGSLKKEGRL